jgi:hypothetical protein
MYYDEVLRQVQRGIEGLNKGLSMGLPKYGKEVDEVQKATYYLFGGETGTGKTAIVDQAFVIEPLLFILKQDKLKLKIFYESYEVDKIRKITKWIAGLMFRDHGIITSLREILSKGDYNIPENVKVLLPQYKEMMDKVLLNNIIISDHKNNPTGIFKKVMEYMEENGKWKEVQAKDNRGIIIKQKMYFPNDPNETVLLIVDHIGLLRNEQGFTKKENIDKLSSYCISLRNDYGVSPVLISQFNRSLSDIDRQRFKEVQPQINDFKDTGNCAEDANVVTALFNPARYNISNYANYEITKINPRYRSAHLLKSRDGEDMLRISLNFLGENGYFRELPNADQMSEFNYNAAKTFTKFKIN